MHNALSYFHRKRPKAGPKWLKDHKSRYPDEHEALYIVMSTALYGSRPERPEKESAC